MIFLVEFDCFNLVEEINLKIKNKEIMIAEIKNKKIIIKKKDL